MAEILIDSYSESNYDIPGGMCNGDAIKRGQSFTASGIKKLTSYDFYLKKALGSPTGNAVAKLYAHSGTYGTSSVPTGSALATSDALDVSTLTGNFQLITFTFTGAQQYVLGAGYYCIAIEYSGGDVSNYIEVGLDGSSPTHSGNMIQWYTEWTAVSTYDVIFYVYGIPIGGAFLLNFI